MARFDALHHPDRFYFEAKARELRRDELHQLGVAVRERLAALLHDAGGRINRLGGAGAAPTSAHR